MKNTSCIPIGVFNQSSKNGVWRGKVHDPEPIMPSIPQVLPREHDSPTTLITFGAVSPEGSGLGHQLQKLWQANIILQSLLLHLHCTARLGNHGTNIISALQLFQPLLRLIPFPQNLLNRC